MRGPRAPLEHSAFLFSRDSEETGIWFGKVVKVEVKDVDHHRTVGEVLLPDGRSLNLELVKAGLAWRYVHYAKHDSRLAAAEAETRKAKRGLWSDPNPVPPWDWRRAKAGARSR